MSNNENKDIFKETAIVFGLVTTAGIVCAVTEDMREGQHVNRFHETAEEAKIPEKELNSDAGIGTGIGLAFGVTALFICANKAIHRLKAPKKSPSLEA